MMQTSTRKFFKRMKDVSNAYLYTAAEVHQRKQIKSLFTKFDTDGSGALDASELLHLYRENDVPVNSSDIVKLFGTDINFTLERFIQITSNKNDLFRYHDYFKKIKEILLSRSQGNRTYMPTTFDETMVDFGFRLSHKHLHLELK